jgi:hypothetical protein
MLKTWQTIAFVAVAAVGGLLAGRALAEDEMGGMPQPEKTIDGHALVKALVGKWTIKQTAPWGEAEAVATFRLGAGKTVLVEDYDSKGMMEFNGMGWFKLGDDGKSITLWWLDSHSKEPTEFKGTVSDTGYEMTGGEDGKKMTMKLVKKGEGFEWTMSGDMGTMTDLFTKAK